MPDIPTALPYRAKIRELIRERGYQVSEIAHMIGRPPGAIYAITGRKPKPTGLKTLRQLAAALSTPSRPVNLSDICDWPGDDGTESEPEPEALAS